MRRAAAGRRRPFTMANYSILYVAVCALIGYWGRDRKFGFWGFFLGALLLTPLVALVLLLVAGKRVRPPEGADSRSET